MRLFDRTGDGADGTLSCAGCTATALVRIDLILEKVLTYAGRALLIDNVSHVLIAEVAECGEYGVRSCLTETAERSRLYV